MFADWNHVIIAYCDGSGWRSNRDGPVSLRDPDAPSRNVTLHFRGWPILQLIIDTLVESYGLRDATEVLYAGVSAGAGGMIMHANRLADMLPWAKKLRVVVNEGFHLNATLNVNGDLEWSHITGHPLHHYLLSEKCTERLTASQQWQCRRPCWSGAGC